MPTPIHIEASIATTWRGEPIAPAQHIHLSFQQLESHLHIDITAPFYHSTPPAQAPGSTPKLWEHEVVEVFILGADDRYLEMEFGPYGHYLLLSLHGERQLVRQGMACLYEAHIQHEAHRWSGRARVPIAHLPPAPSRFNAYAIHTLSTGERRFMARFANTQDEAPNFHRLSTFDKL